MDIEEKLNSLTPEQMEKVERLVTKFAKRNTQPHEHGPGRTEKRTNIILSEDELDKPPQQKSTKQSRGRRSPKNHKGSNRQRRRDRGGNSPGRVEKVELSNKNRFLNMRERFSRQQDTKVDKALWKDRTPLKRPA